MAPSIMQILNIARSGMLSHLFDLDITSHNLANVSTPGYKRSRANLQEMTEGEQYSGVQLRATQRLMTQGALVYSSSPLHAAIQGEGFFAVELPDGRIAYTRDGQFTLDADRQIVTSNGYPLVLDGSVPEGAQEVHINPDGTVMALQNDTWSQVGSIELYRFPNPLGLMGHGQNLWLETETSGEAQVGTPGEDGYGTLVGNAIEGSNVDLAQEMTHIITLRSGFSMSAQTFQKADEMLSQAIHLRQG